MNAPAERPLMMRPPPRSVIDGSTACEQSSGPLKFTSMTRFHSSTGMLLRPYRGRSVMIAALFTRMSIPRMRRRRHSPLPRRLGVDHVDGDPDRVSAVGGETVGDLRRSGPVEVGEHDGRACIAQCTPVHGADIAGSPGDHGDLPSQVEQFRRVHATNLAAGRP